MGLPSIKLGAAFADVNDRFLMLVCSSTKADMMARDGKRVDEKPAARNSDPQSDRYRIYMCKWNRVIPIAVSRTATFAFN